MGNNRSRSTDSNPTGKIPHLIRTRSRRQKQRSDRGQNERAAGPSRRANLRHDVRRCGLFVRLIRVVKLFAMGARMMASRHDCVRRLKGPGEHLLPCRVPKGRVV